MTCEEFRRITGDKRSFCGSTVAERGASFNHYRSCGPCRAWFEAGVPSLGEDDPAELEEAESEALSLLKKDVADPEYPVKGTS